MNFSVHAWIKSLETETVTSNMHHAFVFCCAAITRDYYVVLPSRKSDLRDLTKRSRQSAQRKAFCKAVGVGARDKPPDNIRATSKAISDRDLLNPGRGKLAATPDSSLFVQSRHEDFYRDTSAICTCTSPTRLATSIPGSYEYSRELRVFLGATSIPGSYEYSWELRVFQGTTSIPGSYEYSQGATSIPREFKKGVPVDGIKIPDEA